MTKDEAQKSEIETLQKRVRELERIAAASEDTSSGIVKRDLMKAAWVAPVVLSLSLPTSAVAETLESTEVQKVPTRVAASPSTNVLPIVSPRQQAEPKNKSSIYPESTEKPTKTRTSPGKKRAAPKSGSPSTNVLPIVSPGQQAEPKNKSSIYPESTEKPTKTRTPPGKKRAAPKAGSPTTYVLPISPMTAD